SSRQWYHCINKFLRGEGFIRLNSDGNLYQKERNIGFVIIAVYVDDCLLVGNLNS
ncbi:hypothetical protein SELMODRAFT_138647, partial [Selaginella moellendorffii]